MYAVFCKDDILVFNISFFLIGLPSTKNFNLKILQKKINLNLNLEIKYKRKDKQYVCSMNSSAKRTNYSLISLFSSQDSPLQKQSNFKSVVCLKRIAIIIDLCVQEFRIILLFLNMVLLQVRKAQQQAMVICFLT